MTQETKSLPQISLITASYNKAAFLEKTIRSVIDQGYCNLEYIVIDGGSTDGSLEIIRKYEDSISYWVSEEDAGQSNAINKGIRIASGEVVGWLHADDMLFENALITVGREFAGNSKIGMLYGSGVKIDEDDNVVKDIKSKPFDKKLLNTKCFIFQPSAFYSRDAVVDVGLLDESLEYAMDWDLYIRLSRQFQVKKIDAYIGKWRQYGATKTLAGNYWKVKGEVARIGRKYNGLLDPNYVAYQLYRVGEGFRRAVGTKVDINYFFEKILNQIYGKERYTVRPMSNEIDRL